MNHSDRSSLTTKSAFDGAGTPRKLGPPWRTGYTGGTARQLSDVYAARSLSDRSLTVAAVSSNPFS